VLAFASSQNHCTLLLVKYNFFLVLDFCDNTATPFNAHPVDCGKFVVCQRGIADVRTCGFGLFWDDALQGCNDHFLVPCNNGLPPIPDAPTTQPPTTTTTLPATTAAPTTLPPTTAAPTTKEKFVLPEGMICKQFLRDECIFL